ncbi:hypothetical protein KAT51_02105, partial [bacterium]|nr:hypothetical protein [bacterium]
MVEKKEGKREPEIKEVPKEEKQEEAKEIAEKGAKSEAPKAEKESKPEVAVELSQKAEEIIKGIESLSVLELADLVK